MMRDLLGKRSESLANDLRRAHVFYRPSRVTGCNREGADHSYPRKGVSTLARRSGYVERGPALDPANRVAAAVAVATEVVTRTATKLQDDGTKNRKAILGGFGSLLLSLP